MNSLSEAFDDEKFQKKVQKKFPHLMEIADIEGLKIGNTGMEKGSIRKKYLINFLIDHFGKDRVEKINLLGIDVKIDSQPVKIKTISSKCGVKIKWTVDSNKVENFFSAYTPSFGILLVRLNWGMKAKNRPSGLFWIPIEAQKRVLKQMGLKKYLKPPKIGTNSRGVELSREALEKLLIDIKTKHIDINWQRTSL